VLRRSSAYRRPTEATKVAGLIEEPDVRSRTRANSVNSGYGGVALSDQNTSRQRSIDGACRDGVRCQGPALLRPWHLTRR
jgi:hypothetical protein